MNENKQSSELDRQLNAQVNHVLAALRATAAPGGLEARILERLGDRAAAPHRGASLWHTLVRLRAPALALASAAAIALVLALCFRHPSTLKNASTSRNASAKSATPALVPTRVGAQPSVSAPEAPPIASRTESSPQSLAGALPRAGIPASASSRRRSETPGRLVGKSPTLSSPEADALDDLHAPSHPAPPLPLTAQERLIRRLLLRGETFDLAQLNPAVLAAADRSDEAAFQHFFEPNPLPKPEEEPK